MLRNMIVSKFKFTHKFTGRNKKQSLSSFVANETNVSNEYFQAFRTKSYMGICDKMESYKGFDNESNSSSSSIHDHYIHHCDILPELEKETMANLANSTYDNHCLLDFFNGGLEAWKICEKLLHSVHQENENHHSIARIIKLAESVPKKCQMTRMYKELALYSSLENPLSDLSTKMFPKIHNHLKLLLIRIRKNQARLKRKRTIITCLKKVLGCVLVASYTMLVVAMLVLAFHGFVGIVASIGLISCLLGLTKKSNASKKGLKTSEIKRICLLLDVAAKGIYMLIKDFDTIGSLVGILHNEVEFGRRMARTCVENMKSDVLEEVLREFRVHESRFMEQSEELKDHIYLCLLNVNRSRRLIVTKVSQDL